MKATTQDMIDTLTSETGEMIAYVPRACPYKDALAYCAGCYAGVYPGNMAAAWRACAGKPYRPVIRFVSFDDGVSQPGDGYDGPENGRPSLHWGWQEIGA